MKYQCKGRAYGLWRFLVVAPGVGENFWSSEIKQRDSWKWNPTRTEDLVIIQSKLFQLKMEGGDWVSWLLFNSGQFTSASASEAIWFKQLFPGGDWSDSQNQFQNMPSFIALAIKN